MATEDSKEYNLRKYTFDLLPFEVQRLCIASGYYSLTATFFFGMWPKIGLPVVQFVSRFFCFAAVVALFVLSSFGFCCTLKRFIQWIVLLVYLSNNWAQVYWV